MPPEIKTCSVIGCDKKPHARGWCSVHYGRWRHHGDPEAAVTPSYNNPEEAFEARTIPEPNTGCILWVGATTPAGYGNFWVDKEMTLTHRFAWERVNGPLPEGMHIDHICHTTVCANVEHLRLATPSQNLSNRKGISTRSTSGFRNVYWNKEKLKWEVRVQKEGKGWFKGYFSDKGEAVDAANKFRKELLGEFAGKG